MDNKRQLDKITLDYWIVSHTLRSPQGASDLTPISAFKLLSSSDFLRPTDWRLRELMHTLNYDLIEGNDQWQEKPQVVGSASIHPMKR